MHQTIKDIESQSKYHSIAVMRTNQVNLAKKFKHTIFTKDNQLVYNPASEGKQFMYNLEFDVFKCRWINGKKIVLGDFDTIRSVFSQEKIQKYAKFNIIDFSLLGLLGELQFYLYMKKGKFIKMTPLVIVQSTIIFVFTKKEEEMLKDEPFKHIQEVGKDMFNAAIQYFYFSSEFGLLSDRHFMHNFIRGYRQYSNYQKQGGVYLHGIDSKLIKSLKILFPKPKL